VIFNDLETCASPLTLLGLAQPTAYAWRIPNLSQDLMIFRLEPRSIARTDHPIVP